MRRNEWLLKEMMYNSQAGIRDWLWRIYGVVHKDGAAAHLIGIVTPASLTLGSRVMDGPLLMASAPNLSA